VLPLEYMREVGGLVHERGLVLHLDGARLFNAAAALKVSARELAAPADSITFCLSKALCAPVGSVIVGNKEFIQRAHRIRKQLGGGMRQAGVLAAAGIVALETMTERLAEDHARARRLAAGLAQIPGVLLDPGTPHTNMIFFSLADELPLDAAQASQRLQELEILVVPSGRRRFRLVTHFWIDDLAIDMAIGAFQQVLSA
jgi:threonine aldolase